MLFNWVSYRYFEEVRREIYGFKEVIFLLNHRFLSASRRIEMTVDSKRTAIALNMEIGGTVYILTNVTRTTLYIGVTSDLYWRMREHIEKKYPYSFSARYNLCICVYYETFSSIEEAIDREKEIKKWRREKY